MFRHGVNQQRRISVGQAVEDAGDVEGHGASGATQSHPIVKQIGHRKRISLPSSGRRVHQSTPMPTVVEWNGASPPYGSDCPNPTGALSGEGPESSASASDPPRQGNEAIRQRLVVKSWGRPAPLSNRLGSFRRRAVDEVDERLRDVQGRIGPHQTLLGAENEGKPLLCGELVDSRD